MSEPGVGPPVDVGSFTPWRKRPATIRFIVMFLLRSKRSSYYFKSFGAWTPNPVDARPFSDEFTARAFARTEGIEDVQVVEPENAAPELFLAA